MQDKNLISLIRLYAKYQSDILNDKKFGQELLAKAQKIEDNYKNFKDKNLKISSDLNTDGVEDGIVFITLDETRLGQIVNINHAALR